MGVSDTVYPEEYVICGTNGEWTNIFFDKTENVLFLSRFVLNADEGRTYTV